LTDKPFTVTNSDGHEYIEIVCTNCGYEFSVPVYCGNRLCSVCSFPRRKRISNRIKFCVDNSDPGPDYRFKFLTLTIRNEKNLPGMIKKLVSGFRRLRNRIDWKRKFWGGGFVIEVTGGPGNWHAHLHIIGYFQFINWHKLLKAWKHITGSTGVWIENASAKTAISYVTKYLSKQDKLDPEISVVIGKSLKHLRLFQPLGNWNALSKDYSDPPSTCPHCKYVGSFWPSHILYMKLNCTRESFLRQIDST